MDPLDQQETQSLISEIERLRAEVKNLKKKGKNQILNVERYKNIFNHSNNINLLIEGQVIVDCNEKACSYFSVSKEDIIGKNPVEFFPSFQPDGIPTIEKIKQRLFDYLRGKGHTFFLRVIIRQHRIFDVEVSLNLFSLRNRNLFLVSLRPIAESDNTELQIAKVRKSYNYLVDFIPDGVIVHRQGIILTANPAALHLLEAMKKEQVIGKNLFDMLPPELIPIAQQRMEKLNHGEVIPFFECNFLTVNQNLVDVEVKAFPLPEMGTGDTLIIVRKPNKENLLELEMERNKMLEETNKILQEEVINRLAYQTELIKNQQVTQNIIQSSMDIIVASDSQGRITEFNNAAQKAFGYTREEVIGKETLMLYASAEEKKRVDKGLRTWGFFSDEIINRRKNGQMFICFLNLSEMLNHDGIFIGRVGVSRDVTEQKRQQDKLKKSEEQYREIFENTSDLIYCTTENGRFEYVNQSWLRTLGYNTSDVDGLSIEDLIHPHYLEKYLNTLSAAILEKSTSASIEVPMVKKDNKLVIVEGTINIRREANAKTRLIGTFRDISQEKLAAEKVKLSEERYRNVYNQDFLGICILDIFGRIQQANYKMFRILEVEEQDCQQCNIIDFVHPEDRPQAIALNQDFLNLRLFQTTREIRLVSKTGKEVFGKQSLQLVLDEHGNPDYFLMLFEDNTEIKKANEELLRQNAKFKSLFESSSQSIIVINHMRELVSFNEQFSQSFFRIIGLKPIGKLNLERLARRYLTKDEVNLLLDYHEKAMQGQPQHFEKRFSIAGDMAIWVDLYLDPVIVPGRNISEVSYIVHDITEKKIIEERIKQSLLEKEILLKEVHHRVKNNLQVISSILNLQTNYIRDPSVLDTLRELQNRIKSMALIHENLYQNKDISLLNFGDYILNLTQNLVHSYKMYGGDVNLVHHIEEVHLNLDYSIPCGLIVNELVSNAFKHAFPNNSRGEVEVSIKRKDQQVLLEVADNGVGFRSDLDFRNTDSLGLQLVNALVDQISGNIVQQTSNGTRYTITFNLTK
jgi:PAS domain S-box-containing protein